MTELGCYLPKDDLIQEGVINLEDDKPAIIQSTCDHSEIQPTTKSPGSEFGDGESEELMKLCDDKPDGEKTPSEHAAQKSLDSGYTSSISEHDKLNRLSLQTESNVDRGPPPKTPPKSPHSQNSTKSSRSPKSTSPSLKRIAFSPEHHKKHKSEFKMREVEKKRSLEERRRMQEEALETKRKAILRKHEEADKRESYASGTRAFPETGPTSYISNIPFNKQLQERLKNMKSPKKLGTFGSSLRARSTLNLSLSNTTEQRRKSGSIHNLSSPQEGSVQYRPKSATPRLRRPVSMGALPTNTESRGTLRQTPGTLRSPSKSTTPALHNPIIKSADKKEDKKPTIKNKADIKNLLKPTKVAGFTATGLKKKQNTNSKNSKKESSDTKQTNDTVPITGPPPNRRRGSFDSKKSDSGNNTLEKKRRSAKRTSSMSAKPPSPRPTQKSGADDSPSKSVMNQAAQQKVTQQEVAKLRLEEARKKAREAKARQEEEQRRLEEERRIEEEKRRIALEEAKERMLKEKELRRKQAEEAERLETERIKRETEEKEERERQERETKLREEQERLEHQRVEQEQRRQREEDRLAKEEEERRERQKKLDAILKRTSVKVDTAPKREISANASAILAKHNIQLPKSAASTTGEKSSEDVEELSAVPDVVTDDFINNVVTNNDPNDVTKEVVTNIDVTNIVPTDIPCELTHIEHLALSENKTSTETDVESLDNNNNQNIFNDDMTKPPNFETENDELLLNSNEETLIQINGDQNVNDHSAQKCNNIVEDNLQNEPLINITDTVDADKVSSDVQNNSDQILDTKAADEFTIGITSTEESHLSQVL